MLQIAIIANLKYIQLNSDALMPPPIRICSRLSVGGGIVQIDLG